MVYKELLHSWIRELGYLGIDGPLNTIYIYEHDVTLLMGSMAPMVGLVCIIEGMPESMEHLELLIVYGD